MTGLGPIPQNRDADGVRGEQGGRLVTTVSRTISYRVESSTIRAASAATGEADFGYDTHLPHAVTLDFGYRSDGERVVWTFARDLLADGLTRLSGMQDVVCWTSGVWFHLQLSSPDGVALFRFIAEQVRALLIDTEDLVPYGEEHIDMDAGLARLLGGAR